MCLWYILPLLLKYICLSFASLGFPRINYIEDKWSGLRKTSENTSSNSLTPKPGAQRLKIFAKVTQLVSVISRKRPGVTGPRVPTNGLVD